MQNINIITPIVINIVGIILVFFTIVFISFLLIISSFDFKLLSNLSIISFFKEIISAISLFLLTNFCSKSSIYSLLVFTSTSFSIVLWSNIYLTRYLPFLEISIFEAISYFRLVLI